MVNDGVNNVPPNTIAVFHQDVVNKFVPPEIVRSLVKPSTKKRDWFTANFYRCLPLTIGNQYGFMIYCQFDIGMTWNGGERPEDVVLEFYEDMDSINRKFPNVSSHFGSGIVTINAPLTFRTPPGVNLMTINPPNIVLPNITVMTGVVEADNLRRNFTFNLKLQIPNLKVVIQAGVPLAGFIPIPRYFADKFSLKLAEELFSQDILDEEYAAEQKAQEVRELTAQTQKYGVDRLYYRGLDPFETPFKDHQGPND